MQSNAPEKTPYYLIDKNKLDDGYKKLLYALKKHWDNYVIGYSYKTNALPWVINYFNENGAFAEVVSEDEYELAKLIGVEINRIVYNGPIKTKSSFTEALVSGSYVNIDSQREIEWLDDIPAKSYKLGIRVNFDIEEACPGQSQCPDEGGRFGFCYENGEFEKALKKITEKGFSVAGLHMHVSSKTRSLDIYKALAEMVCHISDKYDLRLSFIDIGGGFFGGLENKPQFDNYLSIISDILKSKFSVSETTLIVEPGMSLIGAPVSYVSSVIDTKKNKYSKFVVTDGSRTSIDPLMTKSSYFISYQRVSSSEKVVDKQIVSGYTCMEHDRITSVMNEPEFMIGDRIIYDKVGAYTMCLTPLFIKYFPDVYVLENSDYIKIRDAWTPSQYVQNSIIGEIK